jgi:hypothetical protein
MRVWKQIYQTNQLCCLNVITGILENGDVTFTTPLHIHTQVPVTWHKLFLPLEIIFLMGSSRPGWKCPRPHLRHISSQNIRGSVARSSSDAFFFRKSVGFFHTQILWSPDAIFLKKSWKNTKTFIRIADDPVEIQTSDVQSVRRVTPWAKLYGCGEQSDEHWQKMEEA